MKYQSTIYVGGPPVSPSLLERVHSATSLKNKFELRVHTLRETNQTVLTILSNTLEDHESYNRIAKEFGVESMTSELGGHVLIHQKPKGTCDLCGGEERGLHLNQALLICDECDDVLRGEQALRNLVLRGAPDPELSITDVK